MNGSGERPERRRFTRLKKTLLVYYRQVDPERQTPLESGEHVGSSLDVSMGGMMLRVTRDIPLQTFLEVTFQPSIIGRELRLTAKVLRHEKSPYEGLIYVPVEFQAMSDQDRSELEEFIRLEQNASG